MWTNCYLDKNAVKLFLAWCKENAEYLLLIEPIHWEEKDKEEWIDKNQQMIERHKEAYDDVFEEQGFEEIQSE